MKTFLVIAHDADDEGLQARRNATREAHFERVAPFIKSGQIIAGGGMLNNEDEVIGSAFFMTFETQDALQEWLNADPLTQNRVWSEFEITPMKLVVRDGKVLT